MDELETSVAVELITEASTEPVKDLAAYVRSCLASSRERVIGLCREATRQVAHLRSA
jgi:hypothetical protein